MSLRAQVGRIVFFTYTSGSSHLHPETSSWDLLESRAKVMDSDPGPGGEKVVNSPNSDGDNDTDANCY